MVVVDCILAFQEIYEIAWQETYNVPTLISVHHKWIGSYYGLLHAVTIASQIGAKNDPC